jgi:hypothetical protein
VASNGVVKNILSAAVIFAGAFTAASNNFLSVPILNNNAFGYGRGGVEKFDETFFANNVRINNYTMSHLCWKNLSDNSGVFLTKERVEQLLQCNIDVNTFNKLKAGYTAARKKYVKPDLKSMNIKEFFEINKEKVSRERFVKYWMRI